MLSRLPSSSVGRLRDDRAERDSPYNDGAAVGRPDGGGFSSYSAGFETVGSGDGMLSGDPRPLPISAFRSISVRNATMDEFCHTLESNLDFVRSLMRPTWRAV